MLYPSALFVLVFVLVRVRVLHSVVWEMSGVSRALSRPAEKRTSENVNALCDFLRVFPCTSVLPPVHTTAVAERMTLVSVHKGTRGG